MDQNLIISENNPEAMQLLLGGELYLIEESQWYEDIKSEGGNKYRFLNIVSHGGDDIIPAAQRDFFFRMSNAIRTDRFTMDADGFAVVNVLDYKGLKWNNLEKIFSPKYCIFWGVDPNKMGLPCKLNGGAVHNACRIIYMDSMEHVFENDATKRLLWDMVKRMFDMNKKP
jgi:hypothetical protein